MAEMVAAAAAILAVPAIPRAETPRPAQAATTVGHTTSAATLESEVERIVRKARSAAEAIAAPGGPGGPDARQSTPATLAAALTTATQGLTIDLAGMDPEAFPIVPVTQRAEGPPLLFADDPEYIRVPEAAVLRERLNPGVNRLYLYHCNGLTTAGGPLRRITAVIRNLDPAAPMRLRMTRHAMAGPGMDYGLIARKVTEGFFANKPEPAAKARQVPAGGAAPLDPDMEAALVKPDQLISGWYEFETDKPSEVTVLQTDPETSGVTAAARIATLLPPRSRSGAGRGYYPYSGYQVAGQPGRAVDTADGPQMIWLADGKLDRWLTGFDSSSSQPQTLKGNYGVVYNTRLRRASTDGRWMAVMLWNARAKSGCKSLAAVAQAGPGAFPPGVVALPSDAPVLRGAGSAALLQLLPPIPNAEPANIELTYTPPGASCLPTPILLVPFDMKR